MLQITVGGELYDNEQDLFITIKPYVLKLEHSLLSISKWESRWKVSFLNTHEKTLNQTIDYVKCMTINPPQDDTIYSSITNEQIEEINRYVNGTMTATFFSESVRSNTNSVMSRNSIITSELIYYWMTIYDIPFECQKWHFNRLTTLIKICEIKNKEQEELAKSKGKRRAPSASIISRNKALNQARKKELNSRG